MRAPDGTTFFDRPLVTDPEQWVARQADVVLLGVPYDLGTTGRPGARAAPRAVRAASSDTGTFHPLWQLDWTEHLRVVDGGDVHCPHGLPEVGHRHVEQALAAVAHTGAVALLVGGDHSITGPALRGLTTATGPTSLVHFDAHTDTADAFEGNPEGHGSPIRRAVESGSVDPRRVHQIGLRSHATPEEGWEWMREAGLTSHLAEEVRERGIDAVADTVLQELDGSPTVYVTVDIDVLDPAFAPGTGTPEPGGLDTATLLRAVRRIVAALPVIGMDVVEVSPPFDPSGQTAHAARAILAEGLAALAARRIGVAPARG
jgi:agmatinase